jgi:hypothetical protein
MPSTDKEAPKRAKARKDRDDPKCVKSYTEMHDPNPMALFISNPEPRRKKHLRDSELPNVL